MCDRQRHRAGTSESPQVNPVLAGDELKTATARADFVAMSCGEAVGRGSGGAQVAGRTRLVQAIR